MTNSIELPVNNYGLYTVTKKLHDNRQHSEHTADIGNKIPHKHIDSFFVADCAFDGESKPLQAQSSPSRRRMPLKRDRTHTTICDRRWLRTKDRNKAIENNSTHTLQNSPKALPTRALQKSPRRTTVNRSPTFLPGDPKRVASILARVNRKNELHGLPATNIAQVPDNLQNSYLSRMPHVPRIGNDSISRYKRNTAKKNNNIKAFQAQLSPKQHLLESGDSSIASIKDKNANTAFAYKSSLADRETSANSNLNKKSALPRVLEQIESLLSRNRSSAHRHKKSLSSDNSSSTAHSNVENNTSTVSNEAVVNHNNIHINSLQSRLVAVQQQLTQQNEEYNARCQILEKHYDQEQEAWHKRMEYQDQQHSQELELLNRKHQKEIFQLAEQIKKLSHDNQVFRQSSSSVDNILTSQTSINYYTHNESSDCVDHQFFKDQITMIQSESISFDIETSKLFNNMQPF
ncbi:hypothetical protein BDF19DRAFT_413857 [Syncephalis fuscata]|nr:hypothetical protein BDF19DRAFT_413857 [Syncephalis fuscata]